jgi:hypothetical protein
MIWTKRIYLLWQKEANFLSMRSTVSESATVLEFHAWEGYPSLDLIKTSYSIKKLSIMVEKEAVVQIKYINSWHMKKQDQHAD